MSNPLAPMGDSSRSGPTALVPARIVARNVGTKVADALHDMGWDGLSDKARRNLVVTGVSTLGCGVLMAVVVLLVLLRSVGIVGNASEPVAVAPPAVAEAGPLALAPGEVSYMIRRGDTLSEIAEARAVPIEAIVARNRGLLNVWRGECLARATLKVGACDYVLYPGRKIVVPAVAHPATAVR